MKKRIFVIFALFLAACSSPSIIETTPTSTLAPQLRPTQTFPPPTLTKTPTFTPIIIPTATNTSPPTPIPIRTLQPTLTATQVLPATPTFDPKTIVTATSSIIAQCPSFNESLVFVPAFTLTDPFNDFVQEPILEFLNAGGTFQALEIGIKQNDSNDNFQLSELDLTNDSVGEILIFANTFSFFEIDDFRAMTGYLALSSLRK